jgi:hypothetical protein
MDFCDTITKKGSFLCSVKDQNSLFLPHANSMKVMELENQIKQLQDELQTKPSRAKSTGDHLPTPPETYSLTGHRDNITAVKFHPVFSVVVSASQGILLNAFSHFH